MAIELLVACVSLVCAGSCFFAGYAARALVQRRPLPVEQPEDDLLEDDLNQVQVQVQIPSPPAIIPTPKSGPSLIIPTDEHLEVTEPMASRAAASLPVLLERLAKESQSESAALFDDQGLVVGSIGPHAGATAGVWASLLARAVADARKSGVFDGDNQVVELRDAKLGRVRCKSVRWHHRRLLLTTVGARAHWSTARERAVLDAVGRLFPISLVMAGDPQASPTVVEAGRG